MGGINGAAIEALIRESSTWLLKQGSGLAMGGLSEPAMEADIRDIADIGDIVDIGFPGATLGSVLGFTSCNEPDPPRKSIELCAYLQSSLRHTPYVVSTVQSLVFRRSGRG